MDPTDEIDQQLDDILLDDLVDAQEELGDAGGVGNLTPGEAVHDERRHEVVTSELARIAEELEIGESTQATAKALFDQFVGKGDIRGYALEVLAAACLYTACKVESIPLSPDDFAAVPQTAFTRVVLLRRVKKISSTLGLDPSAFLDPHGYIDRYCDELGLTEEITARAHEVIDVADEAGIGGGKSPTGRAAAAIYNAVLDHGREATQSEIATVADVTTVTIRNRYTEQRELLTGDAVYRSSDDPDENAPEGGEATPHADGPDSTAAAESAETCRKEVPDDLRQEMVQNIGSGVAENIATALGRLEDTTEELQAQTCDVCQRIGNPQAKRWFGTDEPTLALAVIRFASGELGDPISYPTLDETLEGVNHDIYWVTKLVNDKIK
jgi:hypothetical protein